MKIKKMFVMVLASVLAFSLAACGGTPQNSSQTPSTLPASIDELPPSADPVEELTEKVNHAPYGDESFGLPMLYSQLSFIAAAETETPYAGFASPDEISSSALYNFYLAMAQDDADKYLSANDSKYHIPIEAIRNTLDSYFSGYTFDPKQIVREPEGTCTFSEEAQEIIDSNFVGYGGPAWIEFDNAEAQDNGEIIVSAHGIDMDGNAVDRTEIITVILTASGYQFKSYQCISNALSAVESEARLSDEEVFETFTELHDKAQLILFWYLSDESEDLAVATESAYAPYYKVGRFSTIEEMKAATDEVFTIAFTSAYFYDHAFVNPNDSDTPMYKEIDGELYRNIDQGGMGWPYELADEYEVAYQDDATIVIAVKNLLMGEEEWTNFLLRKIEGVWKIDSYYQMNPHMEYSDAAPNQRENEISAAVSSWFCAQDWTDANQLDANALINYYLYAYLSDVGEYDYEKGYEVSSAELMEGLSLYLNGLEKETLVAINQNQYANARYDEMTDNFYFDITFDPAGCIVINSETRGSITTLEIMIIGGGGTAYTSFLDLEVNGSNIKYVGNRMGEDFTA